MSKDNTIQQKQLLQIKNRWDDSIVIFEGEYTSIRELILAAIEAKKDLSGADLSDANLSDADLSCADLRRADLRRANFSDADLSCADLRSADLRRANFSGADLSGANLSGADLSGADLSGADLSGTDLSDANLSDANLSGADLSGANLSGADLSGLEGLLSDIDWLTNNGERHKEGLVFYKTFNSQYNAPNHWEIKENSIITENVNFLRQNDCGCGINVATRKWVNHHYENGDMWAILIKWEWMVSLIVPYNTEGKIRCGKAQLLGIVDRKEGWKKDILK